MLFYIEYGCSICHEQLIVDAESFERANEYAESAAQEVYYSYDCNYSRDEDYDDYEDYTEEEISELEYQDMLSDIDWVVEPFEEKNEDHTDTLKEQSGIPFEV